MLVLSSEGTGPPSPPRDGRQREQQEGLVRAGRAGARAGAAGSAGEAGLGRGQVQGAPQPWGCLQECGPPSAPSPPLCAPQLWSPLRSGGAGARVVLSKRPGQGTVAPNQHPLHPRASGGGEGTGD